MEYATGVTSRQAQRYTAITVNGSAREFGKN